MKLLSKLLITSLAFAFFACSGKDKPNIEPIQDMMEGPGYKTQEGDPTEPSGSSMRLPPEGTVPRGFTPYKFKGNPEGAASGMKNPIASEMSPEFVQKGREHFETYCSVCHGQMGKGDGPVAPKMPLAPPSLLTAKVKGMTDGLIYHIIADGQGIMGSYANQILAEDRWYVVNYIRSLQKVSDK